MDREYAATVLKHAEKLGFKAVFVTVDTPNTGNREQVAAPQNPSGASKRHCV